MKAKERKRSKAKQEAYNEAYSNMCAYLHASFYWLRQGCRQSDMANALASFLSMYPQVAYELEKLRKLPIEEELRRRRN